LGGTISGEHGIGLEKQAAMRMIFTEDDLDTQRAIKHAFDPKNVLNPGKIIPPPGNGDRQQKSSLPAPVLARAQSISKSQAAAAPIMESIRKAASQKQAVIPMGRGTLSYFGNLPVHPAQPIDSLSLAEVIEYDAPNQVITVGAGLSLDTLQETLQAHNQWLPLRPPFFHPGATTGSLVSLAACGPERMAYGAPRDLLLGLRFVDSQGRIILTGGRVVKDVAGYDMTRLMIGSAGTLGFITEATWRVATIPQRCAAITAEGSLDACAAAARAVIVSDLSPIYVAAVPAGGGTADPEPGKFKIVIGFEGFANIVDYQIEKCGALLAKSKLQALEHGDYPVVEGRFSEIYEHIAPSPFIYRANFPLDQMVEFVRRLDGSLSKAAVFLDFGCGRFLSGTDDLSDDQWVHICDLAARHDGYGLLQKAPDEFKKRNDVFGTPRPEWKVMHRVKRALDPDNIFAPGSLPGKV
jgi:FAD/FMN-containing dehydrogenase